MTLIQVCNSQAILEGIGKEANSRNAIPVLPVTLISPSSLLLWPCSHCFGLICYCHVVYTPLFFIATPPFPVQSGGCVWSGKIHAHSPIVAVGKCGKDMTAFQNSSLLVSHKFWFLNMFCPINQIMEKLEKSQEMNKVASYFKEVCKNGDLGLQRQEMGVDRKMKRMREKACSVVLCSRKPGDWKGA